jgi:hypothetical protein
MRIWPDSRLSRKGLRLGAQTVKMERHWTTCSAIVGSQAEKDGSGEEKALCE